MKLSSKGVYTTVAPERLFEAGRGHDPSEVMHEKKRWVAAARELEDAKHAGLAYPIFFSDSRDCADLAYWAVIAEMKVTDAGTHYRFTRLTGLRDCFTQDLVLAAQERHIAPHFIRPYALVRTPKFLDEASMDAIERRKEQIAKSPTDVDFDRPDLVQTTDLELEEGWLYTLDENGDVSRVPLVRRRGQTPELVRALGIQRDRQHFYGLAEHEGKLAVARWPRFDTEHRPGVSHVEHEAPPRLGGHGHDSGAPDGLDASSLPSNTESRKVYHRSMSGLGSWTVRDAYDAELEREIADLTGLSRAAVRKRLEGAHGPTLVRNAFEDVWPSTAEQLADLTVAAIKRYQLYGEVAHCTGLGEAGVRARLRKNDARSRVKTVFGDLLDLGGDDDATDAEYRPDSPVGLLSAKEARDHELEDEIATIVGLTPRTVKRRLERAHGSKVVRNLFEADWPWTPDRLGGLTVAAVRRHQLLDELVHVTGLSERTVRKRLADANGRSLIKNVFDDISSFLADEEDEDEDEDEDRGDETSLEDSDDEDSATEEIASGRRAKGTNRPARPHSRVETQTVAALPDFSPPQLGPGTLIRGRYEITTELAQGGFARTFEAHDTLQGADRIVVLKFSTTGDDAMLRNEHERTSAMSHHHICRASLDRDEHHGLFLVVQHGGRCLRRCLEDEGPFAIDRALDLVEQVAGALDYVHARSVLHQDVSPQNVVVDDQGCARLTDFGIATNAVAHIDTQGNATLLATKAWGYKWAYAAPEQLMGHPRSRSDQYSLACVFHSMIEGAVLVRPLDRFNAHPRLTSDQNRALQRALDHRAEARFSTCADFAAALRSGAGSLELEGVLERAGELHARISKELESRQTDSETVRVGGVVKIGGALEDYLRVLLLWVADRDGISQAALVERLRQENPRVNSLERCTLGTLVQLLKSFRERPVASHYGVRLILADIANKKSVIWRAVNLRNDVSHGRRGVDMAAAVPLRALIGDFLSEAEQPEAVS